LSLDWVFDRAGPGQCRVAPPYAHTSHVRAAPTCALLQSRIGRALRIDVPAGCTATSCKYYIANFFSIFIPNLRIYCAGARARGLTIVNQLVLLLDNPTPQARAQVGGIQASLKRTFRTSTFRGLRRFQVAVSGKSHWPPPRSGGGGRPRPGPPAPPPPHSGGATSPAQRDFSAVLDLEYGVFFNKMAHSRAHLVSTWHGAALRSSSDSTHAPTSGATTHGSQRHTYQQ
jgi:hypothetical protein